jgi:hypothetical protein
MPNVKQSIAAVSEKPLAAELEPIFVVGCQRSGTTFLGSLLGGSPDVLAIPEAQFVADLAPDHDPDLPIDLHELIKDIKGHYTFGVWGFDLNGEHPPAGRGAYRDGIRWLISRYAEVQAKTPVSRWVDHQPGHVREMRRLVSHFPNLKVVHIIRDGRAVAASIMPLEWGPNGIYSAAHFWTQRVGFGLALRNFLRSDQYAEVRYEDVVRFPERELRRLSAFLGVAYSPEMLEGGGFTVPQFTEHQHGLVGSSPQADRLDSWRNELSARQIEIFESLAGPLLTYLGYETLSGPSPRPASLREKVMLTLSEQVRAKLNDRAFKRRIARFHQSEG